MICQNESVCGSSSSFKSLVNSGRSGEMSTTAIASRFASPRVCDLPAFFGGRQPVFCRLIRGASSAKELTDVSAD
jgi:hypothetical protein